jgi:hypothetical protein
MSASDKPIITLKNIKVAKFASQETHCYTATLYVNGEKWGTVGNDGHGGSDYFHDLPGKPRKDMDQLNSLIAKNYPIKNDTNVDYAILFNESLDSLCSDLVTDHLLGKWVSNLLKNKLVLKRPDGFYSIPLNGKPPEQAATKITMKYPDAEIINFMPINEAIAIMKTEYANS